MKRKIEINKMKLLFEIVMSMAISDIDDEIIGKH